ncbi:MAG: S66 peptidase family protein [Vicinamibacteria bacterium]
MRHLRKPPPLRPPALIGVPAPASPVRKEFVERGVSALERLGFRVRLGKKLYARWRYTAGSPEDRLGDWIDLWEDPEVSALFCARGGYGSIELLPELPPELLRENPKVVLGSSDVTALHAFLAREVGLVSFHGPMVAQQIAREAYDSQQLLELLGSVDPPGRLAADATELLHRGTAEGMLLGGCLSIVAALAGTPYLPSFRGSILFLEDTQVKPFQIDRMLSQLRLAGLLEGVRGIVFGEMTDCEQHPQQGYSMQELLRDWTAPLRVPVLFGFPSGHTRGGSLTLPLGIRCRLDDDGLTLLEGAVA